MISPTETIPEKILVRGVNWLGDAVMSMPAIHALRKSFPNSKLALLTHEKLLDIWMKNHDLDQLIAFNDREGIFSVAKKLREHKFNLAIAFPNSHRSAIELWLSAIPQRIGYDGFLRTFFLTRAVPIPRGFVKIKKLSPRIVKSIIEGKTRHPFSIQTGEKVHHIFNYLRLVQSAGAADIEPVEPKIEIGLNEILEVKNKFKLSKPGARLIGINPGAEYGSAKRWLRERFAQAAIALHKKINCNFCITGGKGDSLICMEIYNLIKFGIGKEAAVVNLAGQTTLRELCAVLKLCDAVITNDTGPMHIAAAVGSRVVAIFGSTSPELTAPGLPDGNSSRLRKHAIIKANQQCAPCFLPRCPIDFRCMKSITTEQVVNATLELLLANCDGQS